MQQLEGLKPGDTVPRSANYFPKGAPVQKSRMLTDFDGGARFITHTDPSCGPPRRLIKGELFEEVPGLGDVLWYELPG